MYPVTIWVVGTNTWGLCCIPSRWGPVPHVLVVMQCFDRSHYVLLAEIARILHLGAELKSRTSQLHKQDGRDNLISGTKVRVRDAYQ